MLKVPKGKTNKQFRQTASGASTNSVLRCPYTSNLKQSSFNPLKRNCSVEVTSENKSLAHSSRVIDEERRVVGFNPSETINSISDVNVSAEGSNNESVKATSKNNRTIRSSFMSKEEHLLALEKATKILGEIERRLTVAR